MNSGNNNKVSELTAREAKVYASHHGYEKFN
jgi:hypothetical protein